MNHISLKRNHSCISVSSEEEDDDDTEPHPKVPRLAGIPVDEELLYSSRETLPKPTNPMMKNNLVLLSESY